MGALVDVNELNVRSSGNWKKTYIEKRRENISSYWWAVTLAAFFQLNKGVVSL